MCVCRWGVVDVRFSLCVLTTHTKPHSSSTSITLRSAGTVMKPKHTSLPLQSCCSLQWHWLACCSLFHTVIIPPEPVATTQDAEGKSVFISRRTTWLQHTVPFSPTFGEVQWLCVIIIMGYYVLSWDGTYGLLVGLNSPVGELQLSNERERSLFLKMPVCWWREWLCLFVLFWFVGVNEQILCVCVFAVQVCWCEWTSPCTVHLVGVNEHTLN